MGTQRIRQSMACRNQTTPVNVGPQQPKKENMPSYHVEMMEGRTIEQKKKLVEAITRVSVEILGGTADAVDIIITDIKRENWATGGQLWSEPRV